LTWRAGGEHPTATGERKWFSVNEPAPTPEAAVDTWAGWVPRHTLWPIGIMAVGVIVALVARTPGVAVFFVGYVWLAFTALDVSLAVFVLAATLPIGLTVHGHGVRYSDVMAVAMALGLLWKYRDVGLRQLASRVFPRAFAAPIVALLLFAVLSLLHAYSRTGAAIKILELVEFFVVIVAVAADMGLSSRSWRPVIAALFIAGVGMALYGILQFTLGVGPASFEVYADHVRAYGTFGQPNVFGALMEQLFPLDAALVALVPTGRARPWLIAALVPIGIGVWVSFSRGAWVADVAAIGLMAVFVFVTRREALMRFVGYGMVLAVALFGAVALLAKIHVAHSFLGTNFKHYSVGGRLASIAQGITSSDVRQRLLIWKSALTAIRQHPITGVGMGEFHDWIATRMPKGLIGVPPQASNLYLEIGADTGILGMVAVVWFQIRWFTGAIRAVLGRLGQLDPWFYALMVGALGIFTAFTVHNLVDYFIDHGVIVPLLLALGLVAAVVRNPREHAA
jgi:O-antigen ligase